jgi:ACS family tartrate transporter-like MFS transporter
MNADLGFSPLVYAWGAGIFFIGYFILEIPGNLALHRFGARRWIARIMIMWDIISACMAFVTGPYSFYAVRFLLGLAEAGFFPGIILYLTHWFPAQYRARVMSAFILGAPLSAVLGGPLCGALLELHNALGIKGWQWLFIAEGVPTVILGVIALFYLRDQPSDAKWLTAEQKAWFETKLASERASVEAAHKLSLGEALRSLKVLALSLVYFGLLAGLYGVQFWLPQIVKGFACRTCKPVLRARCPSRSARWRWCCGAPVPTVSRSAFVTSRWRCWCRRQHLRRRPMAAISC